VASSGRLAAKPAVAKLSDMLADKKALTLSVAKRIAAAAEQEAAKNNWNIFIAIVDDGGNLMFLERMDDSQLASQEVSIAKARSALLFKRPTKALEDSVSGGRMVVMALANAVPVEGGLPLMAYGKIVGAIGISGVSSAQDGIIARAGADELEKILSQG
jgi:glc operon protein GlcG